jgi:hypothetical protein
VHLAFQAFVRDRALASTRDGVEVVDCRDELLLFLIPSTVAAAHIVDVFDPSVTKESAEARTSVEQPTPPRALNDERHAKSSGELDNSFNKRAQLVLTSSSLVGLLDVTRGDGVVGAR